jgi:CCR4-NOT transcription complex subunit 2
MMNNTFGGNDIVDSPSSIQQAGPQPLEQMSDADRFGLPGLLAMMHHPSADLRSLAAQGQDLTTLGLDLTSTEPLHTQLASVFNPSAHTRLPLDADYTLPACYRVANVQALHERIPSFSEETLFYIFYSSPKDLVQELVADELIGRKWRFHKGEKMWVTRDENYPAPVEVEREISEQGFYIWWDWKGWKKVRVSCTKSSHDCLAWHDESRSVADLVVNRQRQYILRYEDLDNGATRNGSALNQMVSSAAPSAVPQSAGGFTR